MSLLSRSPRARVVSHLERICHTPRGNISLINIGHNCHRMLHAMFNAFKNTSKKRPSLKINVPAQDPVFRSADVGEFIPVTPQSPSLKSPSSFPIRAIHEAGWDARHLDKYNVRYDQNREYHVSDIIPIQFCDVKSLGMSLVRY
jgi:hypothetical protein